MGATVEWRERWGEARFSPHYHAGLASEAYRNSPVRVLFEEAEGLRQRLDIGGEMEFSIYEDLRDQGYTDYVGLPLLCTNDQRLASSWVTDVPGGFSTDDLMQLNDLMPVLAMIAEIRLNRRIAKNLLNTYVGRYAGERILAGDITRGSGATLRAAIWTCDMRGFSSMSERWGRDHLIECLNEYFDVMAEPVEEHGGEILKFIGDAMLAVFPLEHAAACHRAFEAAMEAQEGMRSLNARRVSEGYEELGYGIALHVGDVMYGNIGSRNRLDFTVIGPAVNVASRLEELSKDLRRRLIVSRDFHDLCERHNRELVSVGHFSLRGVSGRIEAFGLKSES
jgi:adenylate cyclase